MNTYKQQEPEVRTYYPEFHRKLKALLAWPLHDARAIQGMVLNHADIKKS